MTIAIIAFFVGGFFGALGMMLACLAGQIDNEQGTR